MKDLYSKIKMPLWLILSGLLTSLPLIFTFLGFFQWVSIIPAAIILMRYAYDRGVKLKSLYGMGVLFFGAYYALSFHWFFYMYPLDFAGLSEAASLGVVLIACFGLGLFQAAQTALVFPLFGFITRSKLCEKHCIIRPFCAAALWVIFELWQTIGWWGVPWARLPLGQVDTTVMVRSSALFGSYFVTFVIVEVNFLFAIAIDKCGFRRLAVALAVSLFAVNLALGSLVTFIYSDSDQKITVAAAQGNFASGEKWSGSSRQSIMNVYASLTESAAGDGAEIIVWPETALPYQIFDDDELMDFVTGLAKRNNITIILSAFTEDEDSGLNRNSMIEVKPDGSFGETVYSKQRLVPFGEFVPLREFVTFIFPPLANIGMLEDDLSPGKSSEVIYSDIAKIGCGLCFDSIYEDVILDAVRNGAEIIAISTNDSWFSDSAALDMHNGQARLRAIESGKYVVRSANTGISSIIDPMGNVKEELGALERGYVVSEVSLKSENTLYVYIGNLFAYICVAYVAGMLILAVKGLYKTKNIKKY
ncbi:MAG: apolipoprotein N-acyltransferase [Clostridia bacterium]|nr:apolipoprotein N-acyltransferase [Clostridia bacterium]